MEATLSPLPSLPPGATASDAIERFCASIRALAGVDPNSDGSDGAVGVLVALIESSSSLRVLLEATAALAALCQAAPQRHVKTVLSRGGVAPLARLLQQQSSASVHEQARTFACSVLADVARSGQPNAAERLGAEAGIVEALIAIMAKGSKSEPAFYAIQALVPLVGTQDGIVTKIIGDEADGRSAVSTIVKMVCSGTRHAAPAGMLLKAILRSSGSAAADADDRRRLPSMIVGEIRSLASEPPVALPELVSLLQGVASDEIEAAVAVRDRERLEESIAFGRWIKLPASRFGAARDALRAQEVEAEKRAKLKERREALGIKNGQAQKAAVVKAPRAGTHGAGKRQAAMGKAGKGEGGDLPEAAEAKQGLAAPPPRSAAEAKQGLAAPPPRSKRQPQFAARAASAPVAAAPAASGFAAAPPANEGGSSGQQAGGGAWGFLRMLSRATAAADAFKTGNTAGAPAAAAGSHAEGPAKSGSFASLLTGEFVPAAFSWLRGAAKGLGEAVQELSHHASHIGDRFSHAGRSSRASRASRARDHDPADMESTVSV